MVKFLFFQNGRAGSDSSEDSNEKWQSVFGAVTDRELRLYESAPWSPEAWSAPVELCPLIATRYVEWNIEGRNFDEI